MGPIALLRGVAGLAAAALFLVAAWGLLWVTLTGGVAAQAPDPSVEDGDPCCGYPDTWGEVASGVAWTFGLVVVDALLVCLAVALLRWAVSARWPRLRRLALVPAAAVTITAIVFAVVLVPLVA